MRPQEGELPGVSKLKVKGPILPETDLILDQLHAQTSWLQIQGFP